MLTPLQRQEKTLKFIEDLESEVKASIEEGNRLYSAAHQRFKRRMETIDDQ